MGWPSFLKADLAWHRDIVRSRFNALVAVFVMLVTGGVYILWQGICSRRRGARPVPSRTPRLSASHPVASRPEWVSERGDVAFEGSDLRRGGMDPNIVFSAAAAAPERFR